MKKLFVLAVLAASAALCSASAATHVVDTLTLNDGVTVWPQGSKLYVDGPYYHPSVSPTTQTVTVGAAGAVDFTLVGCNGCLYNVRRQRKSGTSAAIVGTDTQKWAVPDTAAVLTIADILDSSSTPYGPINPQRIALPGAGKVWIADPTNTAWVAAFPASSSDAGVADPGSNGLMYRSALNVSRPATWADIVASFGGGGCSGYLKSDGLCDTPAGGPGSVSTVFGRSGVITAQSGDYNTSQITESGNLYFTGSRVLAVMSGLYESPLTFSAPLSRTGNTISCPTCGSGSGTGAFADLTGLPSDNIALNNALNLKADTSALSAHTARTDNPHSTTKTQVGLSAVVNALQLQAALNLSDLGNVVTARSNLGLGAAALLGVGTTSTTVAAGDHTHPTLYAALAHGHTAADITSGMFGHARLGTGGDGGGAKVLWDNGTWSAPPGASGGEANTASNAGTGGIGLTLAKSGVDLPFKSLYAGSSKLTLTDDTGNNRVAFDVVEANLAHQSLSGAGSNTHAQIDAHVGSTSNPHNTTAAQVGLGSVDNTSDAAKPVSTATQTALALKAPLASPTFTGTVSGITKAMVGLGNVDNTTDAGKPVSTAQAAAIALKADLASPALTGNPTAPTQTPGTNNTRIASTAYADAAAAARAPSDVVASGGTQYRIPVYDATGAKLTQNAYACQITAAGGLECGDGTKSSAVLLKELGANGSNFFAIYGADNRTADACIVMPAGAGPTNGQVLSATASTATMTDGNVCVVMAWTTPTSATYPGAGVAVSTGSAWGTSKTAPTGALVGDSDTQTLTNKTVNGVTPTTFGYLDPTSSVQTQLNNRAALNPAAGANGGVKSGQCTTTTGKLMGYDTNGDRICEADQTGTGGGYATVTDETTPLTQRNNLKFAGAGVTCADDTDKTTCTIPGGGSSNFITSIGSIPLTNAVFKKLSITTTGSAGDKDALDSAGSTYTVPSGKKLGCFSWSGWSDASAGAPTVVPLVKISGTYYGIGSFASISTGNASGNLLFFLTAGMGLAMNTNNGSTVNAWFQCIEFDSTVPLVTGYLANATASTDNVVYTCPSGKVCIPMNINGFPGGVNGIGQAANYSTTTNAFVWKVGPAGSLRTFSTLAAPGGGSNRQNHAFSGTLAANDTVTCNPSGTSASHLCWVNFIEQ
jgi:hypothetical protein